MIPGLLLYKISQLALVMLFGFALVKLKIIKSQDSTVLSKLCLYLLMPAAVINSFDVEMTSDVVNGLFLAFASAVVIHILLLGIDFVYKKFCGGTSVERASIFYSNAANLIIPIVAYVLGDEWVIYSCAFVTVQLAFLWTHGIRLFSSSEKISIKKIFSNINIIAIIIGAVLMIFGIRLPVFVKELTTSLGGMLGYVGMIIAGMLAAKVDFKKMLVKKRLYLVVVMRMIVCPLIALITLKCARLCISMNNADKILLVSFLSSITPSAATIMQLAQLHRSDPDFATAINIVTTLVCIVSVPIFVAVYCM